jgi:hypothetical protein
VAFLEYAGKLVVITSCVALGFCAKRKHQSPNKTHFICPLLLLPIMEKINDGTSETVEVQSFDYKFPNQNLPPTLLL